MDVIDGPWTNLTTHDVSAGLDVDRQDNQLGTAEGGVISDLSFRDMETASTG